MAEIRTLTNDPVFATENTTASDIDALDHLLTVLYTCVSANDGFKAFLEELRRHFRLTSTSLVAMQVQPQKGLYAWTSGYPPGLVKTLVNTGLINKDEGIVRALNSPDGQIYSYSNGAADYDIRNEDFSTFTKAWSRAIRFKDNATLTFRLEDNCKVILLCNRNEDQGLFTDTDIAFLRRLQPHIEKAVDLYNKLFQQTHLAEGLESAISGLAQPMALFSSLNQLVIANQAFKQIGQQHNTFSINNTGNNLKFKDKEIETEFNRQVLLYLTRFEENLPDYHILYLPTERLPLRLTISPVYRKSGEMNGVLIEAHDPNQAQAISIKQLKKIIKCTDSEAKVVIALINGADTKEIAAQLKLSIHTVRSYLKSVLEKNHIHRQVDLVAAILRTIS